MIKVHLETFSNYEQQEFRHQLSQFQEQIWLEIQFRNTTLPKKVSGGAGMQLL